MEKTDQAQASVKSHEPDPFLKVYGVIGVQPADIFVCRHCRSLVAMEPNGVGGYRPFSCPARS